MNLHVVQRVELTTKVIVQDDSSGGVEWSNRQVAERVVLAQYYERLAINEFSEDPMRVRK